MILIKNGRLIDPLSNIDEELDILIEGENIKNIEKDIPVKEEYNLIDAKGLIIAPGLIDIHVHFRDPGQTYKEDMVTGSNAAARGGFTTVVCMANTDPVVDNVDTLKSIVEKSKNLKIEVLQVSTITKGIDGKTIKSNLNELNKDDAWISKLLKSNNIKSVKDILICIVDENDEVFIQRKND